MIDSMLVQEGIVRIMPPIMPTVVVIDVSRTIGSLVRLQIEVHGFREVAIFVGLQGLLSRTMMLTQRTLVFSLIDDLRVVSRVTIRVSILDIVSVFLPVSINYVREAFSLH